MICFFGLPLSDCFGDHLINIYLINVAWQIQTYKSAWNWNWNTTETIRVTRLKSHIIWFQFNSTSTMIKWYMCLCYSGNCQFSLGTFEGLNQVVTFSGYKTTLCRGVLWNKWKSVDKRYKCSYCIYLII